MRVQRSARGLTLIEVVVAVTLLVAVLGSALALLDTSSDLARSVNDERAAAMRVDRALQAVANEFRKGSLATAQKLDGSAFSEGDTDAGFRIRPVLGWNGSAVHGEPVRYEYVLPSGATEGELIRREGPVETVLARGVTDFSARREGNAFVFEASARSGPTDDRERRSTGSVRVMARNP